VSKAGQAIDLREINEKLEPTALVFVNLCGTVSRWNWRAK